MPTLNSIWYQVSGIKQALRKNTKYKILNTKYGKPSGFTLIELLVVIALIGILASFAIASFASAQAKGRDSRRKADLDAVKKALYLYKSDKGVFCPGGSPGCGVWQANFGNGTYGIGVGL